MIKLFTQKIILSFCHNFVIILSFGFVIVLFVSRFIKLRYNLGSGTGEARSNSSINLNTWYTVSVNREDKNATLTVSGDTPVSVISPGTAVSLNVPSSFYLGGVPTLNAINPNAVDSFVQDFIGCIDMFMVCLSFLE